VVTVISPEITAELARHVSAGRAGWTQEPFRPEHLQGAFLVVAATDDETVNTAVAEAAGRHGVLACDASSADRSAVIFGAVLALQDATVAVFTDGRDPARARRTRDRIADLLARPSGSPPKA
jgi:siroheme synthase-like protein